MASGPAPAAPTSAAGNAPAQSCAGRLLSLLRKLIEYGQDLARTVQQRAAAGTILTVTLQFGTRDIALILARITRGLQLAGALEARLVSRPLRPDAESAPERAPAERATRAARRIEPRPGLPDMPTAGEIAAALRHRPAAAVIADICRDLGIVPTHPLWDEVMLVLSLNGGNVVALLNDVMDRMFPLSANPSAANPSAANPSSAGADGRRAPVSQQTAARGTGPP